jgi:hypothetical protein
MTKAQHTPGPWHLDFFDKPYILANRASDEKEIYIAEVTDEDSEGLCPSVEEAQANAHLIAAAPELLAMVKRLRSEGVALFGDDYNTDALDALITKAGGE